MGLLEMAAKRSDVPAAKQDSLLAISQKKKPLFMNQFTFNLIMAEYLAIFRV